MMQRQYEVLAFRAAVVSGRNVGKPQGRLGRADHLLGPTGGHDGAGLGAAGCPRLPQAQHLRWTHQQ